MVSHWALEMGSQVTLVGFLPLVITYALSCWVSPRMETPPPLGDAVGADKSVLGTWEYHSPNSLEGEPGRCRDFFLLTSLLLPFDF